MKVDEFGDNIQATSLPGDHWRTRHNAFLQMIHRECLFLGLPVEMEVYNLFSGLVAQPGLSRVERARTLQAMIPDLRITLPGTGGAGGGGLVGDRVGAPGGRALVGQSTSVLHELKIISSSRSRYNPNRVTRAVDHRADQLQGEYVKKARAVDRKQGVPPGQVGRVEEKLIGLGDVRGIVVGQWGEVSMATHYLLDDMAKSRVRVAGPSTGKRGLLRSEAAEVALAISGLRRRVGVMAVRCQASSLLGRLEGLGPGGAAARGRRDQAQEQERICRREEQAHRLATRQGRRAQMSGFAVL